MKRILENEFTTKCKNGKTAIQRFFKKYPNVKYDWEECLYSMLEEDIDLFCDNKWSDGSNKEWEYALHLDYLGDDYWYICIILRK